MILRKYSELISVSEHKVLENIKASLFKRVKIESGIVHIEDNDSTVGKVEQAIKLFSKEEASQLNDDELLDILRRHWGFDSDEPVKVFAKVQSIQLKTIQSKTEIFLAEKFCHVRTKEELTYPLIDEDGRRTIFIGFFNELKFLHLCDGDWITAELDLSPKLEREKHGNPFGLNAIKETIKIFRELPETLTEEEVQTFDNKRYVEDSIYRFCLSNYEQQVKQEYEQQKKVFDEELDSLADTLKTKKNKLSKLVTEIEEGKNQSVELQAKIADLETLQAKQAMSFEQFKKDLESKMSKLNDYIQDKAKLMVALDLISDDDFEKLTGSIKESDTPSHQLDDIGGDAAVIDYIQAFMWNNHIIYKKSVLKNFFALIHSNDLIVLAGDSGSGKTNLIKSFAKAVGGKAIIIPVKPNWTSAEDLLGYYNPIEQKYLSTPFLEALFEAQKHPETPYFICLDEMNLARVEYYFADFLSLMEERSSQPNIPLYADSEADNLLAQVKLFLQLIDISIEKTGQNSIKTFLDLLENEEVNEKLRELCGFDKGDSLLYHHAHLRKMLSSYIRTPAAIQLPKNVRIIGAINVDETTHYLSPKILDRAHIVRFSSPLLMDWDEVEDEIRDFDLDFDLPLELPVDKLGIRRPYPAFDKSNELVQYLLHIAREYLEPLGIEFGLRTMRQSMNYAESCALFDFSVEEILNNIVLQKILPKCTFDGNKGVQEGVTKLDVFAKLKAYLQDILIDIEVSEDADAVIEMERVLLQAEANDGLVNYWAR